MQADADVDAHELGYLAERLRVGLHELDVEAVELTARGEVPGVNSAQEAWLIDLSVTRHAGAA